MSKQIEEVMALVKAHQDAWTEFLSCEEDEAPFVKMNADASLDAIESKLRELVPVWIDVNKEKPEDEQQVWVRCVDSNGKSTFQAYAIWEGGDWFLDVLDSGDLYSRQKAIKDGLDACTVSHWMPLPKAPE